MRNFAPDPQKRMPDEPRGAGCLSFVILAALFAIIVICIMAR